LAGGEEGGTEGDGDAAEAAGGFEGEDAGEGHEVNSLSG
jgi:hypothetical protein